MGIALQSFESVVNKEDARIDLARACLMIAQDAYPGLEVERYLGEIERMAIRLRGRQPDTGGPEERVATLNQFLFDDLGFWGNTEDYYRSKGFRSRATSWCACGCAAGCWCSTRSPAGRCNRKPSCASGCSA